MSGRKVKYDLIFSLGAACSCAATLINAKLRQFSSPFDWLFGSNFSFRCDILASDFKRFLEEEDLEYAYSERSISCDAYHNKYSDLTFNHDFETKKELKETFPLVKEKYDRRINRLLQNMEKAKSVLIVYIETPDTTEHTLDEDIVAGWQKIQQRFPDTKIDLLYFVNDNALSSGQFEKKNLSENIMKITANYKDQSENAVSYAVDYKVLVGLLSGYTVKIPFKKQLLIYGICCIPFKFLRKRLRRKYHV